jgi:hypothetical protein
MTEFTDTAIKEWVKAISDERSDLLRRVVFHEDEARKARADIQKGAEQIADLLGLLSDGARKEAMDMLADNTIARLDKQAEAGTSA